MGDAFIPHQIIKLSRCYSEYEELKMYERSDAELSSPVLSILDFFLMSLQDNGNRRNGPCTTLQFLRFRNDFSAMERPLSEKYG